MDLERAEETSVLFGLFRRIGNKDEDKGFRYLVEALVLILVLILAAAYVNTMFEAKSGPPIQQRISSTETLPRKRPHPADESIAKALFAAKISSSRLVNDTGVNVTIREVLSRLRSANAFPWPVRVAVLELQDANAFTSGSGYVLLSSGLLSACRTDSELAFVLSHELAHALLKHVPKKMEKILSDEQVEELIGFSRSNNADIPPDLIVYDQSPGPIAKGSQKATESMAPYKNAPDIVKYAHLVLFAHYDQEQELEADRLGVEMMKKAGYGAGEGISLLLRLPDLSSWFSGNLTNKTRIAAIERSGPNQFLIKSRRLKLDPSQGGIGNNSGVHSNTEASKPGKTSFGRIVERGGLNKMTIHSAAGDKEIIIEAGYSEQASGPAGAGRSGNAGPEGS